MLGQVSHLGVGLVQTSRTGQFLKLLQLLCEQSTAYMNVLIQFLKVGEKNTISIASSSALKVSYNLD